MSLQRWAWRLRYWQHRLEHRLGWQRGYVVSGWSNGALWIAHRCIDCGEVSGAHISETNRRDGYTGPPPTEWNR